MHAGGRRFESVILHAARGEPRATFFDRLEEGKAEEIGSIVRMDREESRNKTTSEIE